MGNDRSKLVDCTGAIMKALGGRPNRRSDDGLAAVARMADSEDQPEVNTIALTVNTSSAGRSQFQGLGPLGWTLLLLLQGTALAALFGGH